MEINAYTGVPQFDLIRPGMPNHDITGLHDLGAAILLDHNSDCHLSSYPREIAAKPATRVIKV